MRASICAKRLIEKRKKINEEKNNFFMSLLYKD
jgi:hypothetical protein